MKLSWSEVLKAALRVFGYTVAFGFIGFMFVPVLISAGAGIRMPVVGLLIAAGCALMFLDGASRGERDAATTETLTKLAAKGDYQPTKQEDAKRFSRAKGILSAAIAALPLFLIALYVALTAQPFTYTLQDTPSWLAAYTQRPEIGQALAYLNVDPVRATLTDYLRVAVRFMLFPYVGFFGVMDDAASLLFDRIAPALSLILPTAAAIGYQFGPARRRKYIKSVEAVKRTPRKRLKKDRNRQPPEKKQLI